MTARPISPRIASFEQLGGGQGVQLVDACRLSASRTAHSRSSASANSGTAAKQAYRLSQREHQGAWIWPGRKISRKFNDELRKLGYEQRETGFWNNRPSMVVVPERIAVVVPERIAVVVPERIAVL